MNELLALVPLAQATLAAAFAVFLRVAAAMAFLPGFGEQSVPMRVRLIIALAFTLVILPAALPYLNEVASGPALVLSETIAGLALGALLRLFVFILHMAGSMAAQSTSLSQILGGAAVDPQPAMGHVLLMAGLALAMLAGLHVRLAEFLILSYEVLPPGVLPGPEMLFTLATGQTTRAFALAFTLAAPFVIASLVYNVALGAINRAMPQLMVAFVGAPAITAGGLILLAISAPILLSAWLGAFNGFLAGGGF